MSYRLIYNGLISLPYEVQILNCWLARNNPDLDGAKALTRDLVMASREYYIPWAALTQEYVIQPLLQ